MNFEELLKNKLFWGLTIVGIGAAVSVAHKKDELAGAEEEYQKFRRGGRGEIISSPQTFEAENGRRGRYRLRPHRRTAGQLCKCGHRLDVHAGRWHEKWCDKPGCRCQKFRSKTCEHVYVCVKCGRQQAVIKTSPVDDGDEDEDEEMWVCPECGKVRKWDERVAAGMKCAVCAYAERGEPEDMAARFEPDPYSGIGDPEDW